MSYYALMRGVFRIVLFILLGTIRIHGREKFPREGPYIIVVNHMSMADTPMLLLSLPPGLKLTFFAGEKWAEHWLWGPLLRFGGAIFIDRENVSRRSLQQALRALANGAIFGLAPEGRRSKKRSMMEAKDGAAYLATRADVPVVPVGLVNSDVLFENFKRLRPTRLEVHVGEPIQMPDLDRRIRAQDLAAYTHYIMVHIAALLPPRYHGAYAASPALAALQRGEDPWPAALAADLKEA